MTINRFYLFLTFLVIAISGNPAMDVLGKEIVYIGTLMIFMVLWWFKPLRLTRQDVLIFGLFALIALTHVISFGAMVFAASMGFLIKLGIAMLAVRLIPEFPHRYVSVMYVLSITSFVFFIPLYFGVDMRSLFSEVRAPLPLESIHYHIGIYNLRGEYDGSVRNMGMFWEAGAFAGFLILALFLLIRDGQLKAIYSKQGWVLIAALLSTQSTTGYIAFLVLAVFYVYSMNWIKNVAVKWVVFILSTLVLLYGALLLFSHISFLGEKITAQIQSATLLDESSRINRIGNFIYDKKWIVDRPIFGWSANPETRLTIDPEVLDLVAGQGNGLTGFTIKFGLFGIALFVLFFAYSTHRISGSLQVVMFGVAIVGLLLNGEQFLNFPMFLSLMFLPKKKLGSLPRQSVLIAHKPRFVGKRMGYRA